MEVKKKLKNFLNNYCIVLKVVLLLMLVLGLQMIFSPTCLAYMSSDYLDYGIDTLKDNYIYNSNQTVTNNMRSKLSNLTNEQKNFILTSFNQYLFNNNMLNMTDINFIFCARSTGSDYYLNIFICNNDSPNGSETIDYFLISTSYFRNYHFNQPGNFSVYQLRYNLDSLSNPNVYDLSYNTGGYAGVNFDTYSFNFDNSILTIPNVACYGIPQGYCYLPLNNSTNTIIPIILKDSNGNYQLPTPPEPEEPSGDISSSTGTITNNSGETTGSINLSGIEQGIIGIQNTISGESQRIIDTQNQNTQTIVNAISGETQKITNTLTESADETIDNTVITSGDIESSLGFEIAENPYSNFWTTLTNNLKTALLGSKRSIDISFQGRTWTISLDEYLVLPTWLTIILIPFSTAFFTWFLVRQWKIIFDKLASGNIDSLLKDNSEEGISNLF